MKTLLLVIGIFSTSAGQALAQQENLLKCKFASKLAKPPIECKARIFSNLEPADPFQVISISQSTGLEVECNGTQVYDGGFAFTAQRQNFGDDQYVGNILATGFDDDIELPAIWVDLDSDEHRYRSRIKLPSGEVLKGRCKENIF